MSRSPPSRRTCPSASATVSRRARTRARHVRSALSGTRRSRCRRSRSARAEAIGCTGSLRTMLTLFTLPKPFSGESDRTQRVALESWRRLGAAVEVILVGDEPGIAEAAAVAGVGHLGGVLRSARGTPRLDDAFARVDAV